MKQFLRFFRDSPLKGSTTMPFISEGRNGPLSPLKIGGIMPSNPNEAPGRFRSDRLYASRSVVVSNNETSNGGREKFIFSNPKEGYSLVARSQGAAFAIMKSLTNADALRSEVRSRERFIPPFEIRNQRRWAARRRLFNKMVAEKVQKCLDADAKVNHKENLDEPFE